MPAPASSRYLIRVNGVIHYRRIVPATARALAGCRVWKRSLKTRDLREAEARSRPLAVEHDQLIAQAKGHGPERQLAVLNDLGPVRIDPADIKGNTRRVSDRLRATLNAREDAFRSTIVTAELKLSVLTGGERDRIDGEGGLISFGSRYLSAREKLRQLKRTAIKDRTPDAQFVIDGRERDIQERGRILEKLGVTVFEREPDDPRNPRLSAAIEKWFKERKQGSLAVQRHRVAIRRFTALHGDVPIRKITRQHVKDYLGAIENLADHRRLPTSERGTLADPGADVPRVSSKTVERHLITIKALLRFGIEQEWCPSNPADGLRPPKDTRPKASKRRPFTSEERRTLLACTVEECGENGDMTWLIKLAAYTGARLEELCQLARKNVKEIEGVPCIEIDDLDGRTLKNAGSVRTLPLHPAIADDFLEWVRSGKGDRVFMSARRNKHGRFSNETSGDFARLMDRAGLPDPRLTFHSLRHTLKRVMSDARIDPDVRRAMLGHSARDVHDEYGGSPSLATMARELARLPVLF